jgi:chemotaxis protein MotB
MSAGSAVQPIIIIRRKGRHGHKHHGGSWKVAYADFVTALMSLFIVLWLLNSSEQVRKAIGGYFQDPTGNGRQVGSTMFGSGETLTLKKEDMEKLKQKLADSMQKMPQFKAMKDNISMSVTGEGLRIELLETEKGMFFETGSTDPSPFGRVVMTKIAQQLSEVPNRICIEGHTDSHPFVSGGAYGNWELSADRANASRRWMETHGLRSGQVGQVRGYADQKLRKPQAPTDFSNRRISLIVEYETMAANRSPAGAVPKL